MTKPTPLGLAGEARGVRAIASRAEASPCQHRIRYETPNGELARGECRYCGLVVHHRNACAADYDKLRNAPTGSGLSGRRGGWR